MPADCGFLAPGFRLLSLLIQMPPCSEQHSHAGTLVVFLKRRLPAQFSPCQISRIAGGFIGQISPYAVRPAEIEMFDESEVGKSVLAPCCQEEIQAAVDILMPFDIAPHFSYVPVVRGCWRKAEQKDWTGIQCIIGDVSFIIDTPVREPFIIWLSRTERTRPRYPSYLHRLHPTGGIHLSCGCVRIRCRHKKLSPAAAE